MSYILEALKKSDAERKRGEVPTLSDAPAAASYSTQPGAHPVVLIAAGAAAVLTIGGTAAWLMLGGDSQAPAPAPQEMAQAAPKVITEVVPEVAPEVAPEVVPEVVVPEVVVPEVVPEVTPEPIAEAKPEPQPKALPEAPVIAEVIAELKAEPVPSPTAQQTAPPIPAPVSVVKPAVKPAPTKPVLAKPAKPALPTLKSASAYVDRAWTSMDKGLYAQALADLDRAVAREPAFADAWFARGWALEKSGDEANAIHDYGRAIDAQPDHAFALFSRGFLNLYGGNPRDAVVDFVRTQGVATDDSLRLYTHLWLYLSRTRAGQAARPPLQDATAGENLARWPGPLVLHFMDAMDESAVLNAIEQGPKAGLKERRATGYYFLGISAQIAGNADLARRYFEKTLATNPTPIYDERSPRQPNRRGKGRKANIISRAASATNPGKKYGTAQLIGI